MKPNLFDGPAYRAGMKLQETNRRLSDLTAGLRRLNDLPAARVARELRQALDIPLLRKLMEPEPRTFDNRSLRVLALEQNTRAFEGLTEALRG